MFFPSQLYQPRAFDVQQGNLLRAYARAATITQNAASLVLDFSPPDQQSALLLQNIECFADPDGALNVITLAVALWTRDPAGANTAEIARLWDRRNGFAAGVANTMTDGGMRTMPEVLVLPQEFLRVTAAFSGAGVTNNLQAWVSGVVIPRGNLQRV